MIKPSWVPPLAYCPRGPTEAQPGPTCVVCAAVHTQCMDMHVALPVYIWTACDDGVVDDSSRGNDEHEARRTSSKRSYESQSP